MQTLANFALSVVLKLSLVDQFGHFQVGLHGFHCHVPLAAIKSVTREQACILNMQMIIYIYPKQSVGSHRQWFMLFTRQRFFN